MRKLLVVIVVLLVLGVLAASCTGVVHVPVLSSALGMDKAPSLGEQPADPASLAALQAQLGVTTPSPEENYTLASQHTFSGSVPLDETVSEATLMALPEVSQSAPGISDVHIRFHDGYVETSAMVDLAPWGYPFSGPVDATWRLEVTGPQAATVHIDSLKFGAFGVPGFIQTQAEDAINAYLATRLAQVTGLDMQKVAFVEGGIDYAGSIPQTYEASAPVAGQLP